MDAANNLQIPYVIQLKKIQRTVKKTTIRRKRNQEISDPAPFPKHLLFNDIYFITELIISSSVMQQDDGRQYQYILGPKSVTAKQTSKHNTNKSKPTNEDSLL